VEKETGMVFTEVSLSIKINDNIVKDPKLIAHSFYTYCLIYAEKMSSDIRCNKIMY
jgi:hypothetical protein